MMELRNCWEIMACGREFDGVNVNRFGECPASKEGLGHSCWIIAGTYCDDTVQGTYAQKIDICMLCKVYGFYNRMDGVIRDEVEKHFTVEESKYREIMIGRLSNWNKQ